MSFTKNGFVVGEDAKMSMSEDPKNTIFSESILDIYIYIGISFVFVSDEFSIIYIKNVPKLLIPSERSYIQKTIHAWTCSVLMREELS